VTLRVFIEDEAGSTIKHHHDEKALLHMSTEEVSRPYPFPYGFVIGTTSGDGDNVDCFVITGAPLRRGDIVDCVPIALLEQTEAGEVNHNVLAVPAGEQERLPPGAEQALREFILHFRDHQPEIVNTAGRLLPGHAARAFVEECRDQTR
jgi:inorganic pyrophosphatase